MRYRLELVEAALWQQFHQLRNEMIITKAGRCLFPLLRLCLVPDPNGELEVLPTHHYRVLLTVDALDEKKWKWRQGHWVSLLISLLPPPPERPSDSVLGPSSAVPQRPTHPPIVFYERISGAEMRESGLSFDKLKLSNRPTPSNPYSVTLQSFHRYIPAVHVSRLVGVAGQIEEPLLVKRIPQTEFIAVTHYQNAHVTLLKKSYNPHAKGFVISEEPPALVGTTSWMLSPEQSSPPDLTGSEDGKRRPRKRIRPISSLESLSPSPIPSDEEELQGSLALQGLASDL